MQKCKFSECSKNSNIHAKITKFSWFYLKFFHSSDAKSTETPTSSKAKSGAGKKTKSSKSVLELDEMIASTLEDIQFLKESSKEDDDLDLFGNI